MKSEMNTLIFKENGNTLRETFKKIFDELGIAPQGKILIKPNFSGRSPIIEGENTDPVFLKELAEFLIGKGAEEIIIAHGGLLGTADRQYPFDQIIDSGGFASFRQMPKITLFNLDKDEKELVESNGFKFLLPKILKNVDLYINLAKLKTHMETTVSLSVKNQMGLVAPGDRVNMHHTKLHESLAALGAIVKPDLSIIDGIVAMEGNGPHHGKSRKIDVITAGTDMVKLDCLTSHIVGIDFKTAKHVCLARELGVGEFPSEEELREADKFKIPDFVQAAKYEKFGNITAWPTTACSRCITAINESGKLIKKHPFKNFGLIRKIFLSKKKMNVVIGRAEGLELPKGEKVICIGKCSQDFADKNCVKCLNKCPPSVEEALNWLKKEI